MKKKDYKWEVVEALALITQIALSMILCMAISLAIGYGLDVLFGTRFITIIMIFVGIGAAIRSMIKLAGGLISSIEKNDKKENE